MHCSTNPHIIIGSLFPLTTALVHDTQGLLRSTYRNRHLILLDNTHSIFNHQVAGEDNGGVEVLVVPCWIAKKSAHSHVTRLTNDPERVLPPQPYAARLH